MTLETWLVVGIAGWIVGRHTDVDPFIFFIIVWVLLDLCRLALS